MKEERLLRLIDKVNNGTASPEDYRELGAAIKQDETGELAAQIDAQLSNKPLPLPFDHQHWMPVAEAIVQADRLQATENRVHHISLRRVNWFKYVAAAVIVLAFGLGVYYFNSQSSAIIGGTGGTVVTRGDIAPGGNKAIWTLADGKQIELDSTVLDMTEKKTDNIGYNELRTPRGGQYQLILPDGSKVWLNAESSIKYPVVFNAKERRVDVTGEVYFEIAKDVSKPFNVAANGQEIEVLGTAFNINAYNDEPFKTSLAEGAIKINQFILKSGQAYSEGKIIATNLEQDLAWKNGFFYFENLPLASVIRQLARWYDVDPIYTNGIPNTKLAGSMDRNLTLSQVLESLRDMNVNCSIQGRKLIIAP